jgi:outer membrane protein assembly factor BamB
VTAYSGREPKTIWRREDPEILPYLWAQPIGDLTGDGTFDLVQKIQRKDAYDVIDGATGKPLWTLEGMFPYALGDIDRDGRVEIGVKSGYLVDGFAGERFTAYRSDGRRLYQETYGVDLNDCGGFCLVWSSLLHAGDLQGDGVRDTFVLRRRSSDGESIDEMRYLVDGRNGKLVYTDERYVPLLTSIDGRGDDFGSVVIRRGRVTVRTFDGRDGAPLWRARMHVPGAKELGNWLDPYAAGVDLNADGCGDMLVTLQGEDGGRLIALNGRNGSVLWTRALTGDLPLAEAVRSGRTLRC